MGTDPCGDKWIGITCIGNRVTAMLVSAASRDHIWSFPSSCPLYRRTIHHSLCCCCWWLFLQKTLKPRIVRIPFRRHPVSVRTADLVWNFLTFIVWFESPNNHMNWNFSIVASMWGDCRLFFAGTSPTTRTWVVLFLHQLEAWVTSKTCEYSNFKGFQLLTDFEISIHELSFVLFALRILCRILVGCSFSGEIPKELGQLSKLIFL